MNYFYTFDSYEEETPNGDLKDYALIEVLSENEKEATERALALSGKKEVKLRKIMEYFPADPKRPQYIITLQAYLTISGSQLVDGVLLELWDSSVEKAMDRAKKLVERKFYRLKQAVEKLPTENA
jgi:hypothetical protein